MHAINTLLERLDPDFVEGLKDIKARIIRSQDGLLLADNICHIPGVAIHFNQDGEKHTDRKSLHSGWDVSIFLIVTLSVLTLGPCNVLGCHSHRTLQEVSLPTSSSQTQHRLPSGRYHFSSRRGPCASGHRLGG
jgi:hypothetical protein